MKICDWLFPWRAKRYLEESDKLHSQLLSSLQSLTDQLTNLQIERQKLVDTYDKLQESYKDQITDITTMFHVEQSKLNEALAVAHENNKRVLGEKFGLLDEERESLTKRAVSAEEALKVSKEETVAEQRKIRALERWIKNVHRLDNESTEGTIKRIMQQSAMATKLFFIIGIMLMTSCVVAQQPPILRTFFDTNPAPIVDVVGGVGITVTPSTPNVQTRRFAVDATGSTVASNIYGSNVIGPVNLAISATNWIGMDVFSNQVYLDMTNLNTFTSNALQQSMSNTVDYVSNILVLGSIDGSNQMHLDLTNLTVLVSNSTHLDMTNLNTFTSNSLQQSMSNYVNGNRDNTPAYVRSTFPENTNILLIQYSLDGDTWASITADGSAVWTNTLEVGTGVVLRDPSIMYDPLTAQFYVAFTHKFVPGVDPNGFTKYFGLISSSNLLNWYPVGTGLVPVITTNGQVFAPEWYQEGGTNFIIYSLNISWIGIGETHCTWVYGGNFTNWPLSTNIANVAYDGCISRRSNIWYLWVTDSGIIPELYTNWYGVVAPYTHAKTGIEQPFFEGPNVIPWYGGWRMYYSASDHGECFYTTNNDPLTLYDATASTNRQVEIPTNTVDHGTTFACTGDAKTKLLAAVCNRFNSTNTILRGTVYANIAGVAYLASNQTFTGDNKFLGNYNVMQNLDVTNLDGSVDTPLRVRAPWDQAENLQTWSTGSTIVAFVDNLGGLKANILYGTNLTIYNQAFINNVTVTNLTIISSLKANNASLTNGVNYSNAFSSVGGASGAEQFGVGSVSLGVNALAIGFHAATTNTEGVAIGKNSVALEQSVALGATSLANSNRAVAIGNSARADAQGSIAIGYLANSLSNSSVAIGPASSVNTFQAIAFGNSSFVDAPGGIAIGSSSSANQYLSSAFGFTSLSDGTNCTAIGAFSFAGGSNSTALGYSANAGYTNSTAIGTFANATTNHQIMLGSSNDTVVAPNVIVPTNGLVYQGKNSFYTNFSVVQNLQLYNCNGSNQVITLPNAATYPWQIFRFSSTNGYGSFILTNATGAQTIRDGTNLFLKNIGVGELGVYSDGAAWWIASKAKTVFPNASWSCSTNIPLVSAVGTSNVLTLDTLEFNNSQGIALEGSFQNQRIWITNSGQYFFTFSAVCAVGNAGDTNFIWIKQNGTNMPRTRTDLILGKTGSINHQVPMTVNFIFNITAPTFFQIVGRSSGSGASIVATGSDATIPAMPSVIVTINRISDTYP